LAIAGLAGVYPLTLLSLSAIGIGVCFLLDGAAVVRRISTSLREATEGKTQMMELGPGTTGETLAGITGIALGLLGLFGVVPVVLMLCAAIVFGAALAIGSRTRSYMHKIMLTRRQEASISRNAVSQIVLLTTGLQVLLGLAAFALGIIGLGDAAPLTLSLVAMLVVAVALVLTSPALVSRVMPALQS
jgi:cation transporter-like permease